MLKIAIKKYFCDLKYYLLPLGIMLIFIFSAVLAMILGIKFGVNEISDAITSVKSNASDTINVFTTELTTSIKGLFTGSKNVEESNIKEFIETLFKEAINTATGTIGIYEEAVTTALTNTVNTIFSCLIFCMIDIMGGLLITFYFTKFIIRRKMVKRTIKESLKSLLIGTPMLTIELIIIGLLIKVFSKLTIVYIILGLLVYAIGALIKSYVIQKKNGLKLNQVLNIKNVFMLYLSDLLIFIIASCFAGLVLLIPNNVIGGLLAFPFVLLALIQISLMSESYVSSIINK